MAAIKGRLWANVFKFSLDLDLYGDAYCAIISNPDEESKFICLRRFIVVLCERKVTQVLCAQEFPYAGLLEKLIRSYCGRLRIQISVRSQVPISCCMVSTCNATTGAEQLLACIVTLFVSERSHAHPTYRKNCMVS